MSSDLPPDITGLLLRSGDGDEVAREQLLAAVHRELHDRAAALMRGQPSCHTLQATALVNEAYLRLLGANGRAYQNRTHFLAVAATAMRQILVDHARSKGRAKRSAPGERVPLDGLVVEYEQRAIDIDLLDRVMEELAEFDPAMVRAVEMRFFADMTAAETAEVLGIAMRTFERRWNATRSWLMQRLEA
ncbi:MAG: ECF-type sigma factor [Planctomycetota bacterium]